MINFKINYDKPLIPQIEYVLDNIDNFSDNSKVSDFIQKIVKGYMLDSLLGFKREIYYVQKGFTSISNYKKVENCIKKANDALSGNFSDEILERIQIFKEPEEFIKLEDSIDINERPSNKEDISYLEIYDKDYADNFDILNAEDPVYFRND